ncbi:MAG: hypothetical protein VW378_01500 [bacterium]
MRLILLFLLLPVLIYAEDLNESLRPEPIKKFSGIFGFQSGSKFFLDTHLTGGLRYALDANNHLYIFYKYSDFRNIPGEIHMSLAAIEFITFNFFDQGSSKRHTLDHRYDGLEVAYSKFLRPLNLPILGSQMLHLFSSYEYSQLKRHDYWDKTLTSKHMITFHSVHVGLLLIRSKDYTYKPLFSKKLIHVTSHTFFTLCLTFNTSRVQTTTYDNSGFTYRYIPDTVGITIAYGSLF